MNWVWPSSPRPGAVHIGGRKIAAFDQAQRVHQFRLEQVRSPAIIGQGGQ